MSTKLVLLAALVALFGVSILVVRCDEERIITRGEAKRRAATEKPPEESTGKKSGELTEEQRKDIIWEFFEYEGIDISPDFDKFDLYDADVVEKMQEAIESKKDFIKVYHLNAEINSMIHEAITKRVEKADSPLEIADEATLQALDLIVPDSGSQPVFEMAKKDLRQFYLEQPEHGRELLERMESLLDSEHLHTMDAITQLEGFYYQWAPLGRLTNYIETHGQS